MKAIKKILIGITTLIVAIFMIFNSGGALGISGPIGILVIVMILIALILLLAGLVDLLKKWFKIED